MDVLLSPVVLFFLLGAGAAALRSDLAVPESLAKGMSLYLMMAIGLKGGAQVSANGFSVGLLTAVFLGVLLSCVIPVWVYWALRKIGRLTAVNAGAVAAHYGSVSVVTFAAGSEMLTAAGIAPAGYMVAVLALMETPAIIIGLMMARLDGETTTQSRGDLMRETLLNGPVVLLMGSFVIGYIVGLEGLGPIAPVFENGFRGVLCLFLLDMGLIAVRRLRDARSLNLRLVVLAVVFPVVNGTVGVMVGTLMGLDAGSAAALGILAASASYIAVPAAMRFALPQADAGLSLAMSLAITFPFNVILGIPIYIALAKALVGG